MNAIETALGKAAEESKAAVTGQIGVSANSDGEG